MTEKRIRVQFDLSPEVVARHDRLTKQCGFQTRAELFRAAIAAFEKLVDFADEGWVVKAHRGEEVIQFLPLVSVR
jgi:hypothetical protein